MPLDLVTVVESVERKPDGHEVEVSVQSDAMMPKMVQELRARGRAMVAVGVIDVGSGMGRDVAKAITDLSFGEIDRATEVTSKEGKTFVVKVNSN